MSRFALKLNGDAGPQMRDGDILILMVGLCVEVQLLYRPFRIGQSSLIRR